MIVLLCLGMFISTLMLFLAAIIGFVFLGNLLVMSGPLGCLGFFALITVFVVFIFIPWVVWWDIKYKKLKAKKK